MPPLPERGPDQPRLPPNPAPNLRRQTVTAELVVIVEREGETEGATW